ncbi:MAG: hypothetical protein JWQ00_904, partial [Noviherbaspirillum sp.]|nr:hypothetical protein [Noviherbaspirillum sp.]
AAEFERRILQAGSPQIRVDEQEFLRRLS